MGLWSAIPYALYCVGLLLWLRRPREDHELRRAAWLAPLLIAAPFAVEVAARDLFRGRWEEAAGMMVLWGGCALLVGYAYAAFIEIALIIGKSLGYISSDGETTRAVETRA